MAYAYLDSTDIKVFPTAHRAAEEGIDQSGFRLSEEHLGQLLTGTSYRNSFVKEFSKQVSGQAVDYLLIVLNGHIFEAAKNDITSLFSDPADADIISAVINNYEYTGVGSEIVTVEDSGVTLDVNSGGSWKFKGLGFTLDSTSELGDNYTCLEIMSYDDEENQWNVISDAKLVLKTNQILDVYDGMPYAELSDSFHTRRLSVTGEASNLSLPNESIITDYIADKAITSDKLADKVVGKAKLDFDAIYPIGSIYMSVNSTNPHDLFGGTWEQIKDKFLLSAGDTYSVGATGGDASYTLTEDNIPQHRHSYSGNTGSKSVEVGGQQVTGIIDRHDAKHSHTLTLKYFSAGIYGVGSSDARYLATYVKDHPEWLTDATYYSSQTSTGHSHNYSLSTASKSVEVGGQSYSGNTSYYGSAVSSITPVPTMPPYLVVYMWKRVADPE